MIVVLDTTPLNYLILIEEIEVLPRLFDRVYVPTAVLTELRDPKSPERVRRWADAPPKWLTIPGPSRLDPSLPIKLGDGEVAAISLAQELQAALLLDDKEARKTAEARKLPMARTLSILVEAACRDLIDMDEAISKLRETTYRAKDEHFQDCLEQVRERKEARDRSVQYQRAHDVGEAGESVSPPTRMRYAVLASACTLAVITYIHRAGFQSNSPELLRDLGMDVRDLSAMTVVFMLAYGLFEVPWGRLGDRFGAHDLLVLVVLGGSLMTAGVATVVLLPRVYSVQLGCLLLVRFLFGMFQAGTFPVLSRLIADWIPTTERGAAQGLLWMCSRTGGVLAPIVMIWLYHRLGNWRSPLVLGASLGLLWCLAVWPWLRNRPDQMRRVNAAERALIAAGRPAQRPAAHRGAPWGAMLRSSNVWALWGMYGFLGFSGNFFLYMFTSYLQDYRHLDKDTAKWLTVVPFACGVAACISGGVLSDVIMRRTGNRRMGRRLVGGCGLTLAGVMILVSAWVDDVHWLGIVYGLTFFGNDLSMGPAWAAASDIGERHAGTLAGAMNMIASLMSALAAIVAGQLFHAAALAAKSGDLAGHRFFMTFPFMLFATSYLLGALCWLRVDVTETIPQELG